MNRRGFLGVLLSGLVLDPERALWVPGRKLISIPRRNLTFVQTSFQLQRDYNRILSAMAEAAVRQVDAEIADYLAYGCAKGAGYFTLHEFTAEYRAFIIS